MIKEFAFINLFRAGAAFWVLLAHCMIWGGWYGIPLPPPKIAVDLFMMISGYLMAANAYARSRFEPLTTARNWLRFWLRRFFRLAPAYYVSLFLAVISSRFFLMGYEELQSLNPEKWLVGGVTDPKRIEYTVENVLIHVSFLFGLHPTYSFSTFLPDWSLSLEMQFYFIFPALYVLMRKQGFIIVAIFLGLPIFFIGKEIAKNVHYFEPSLILFKLNYFIAGILLFRFLVASKNKYFIQQVTLVISAIFLVSLEHGKWFFIMPLLFSIMLILGWLETHSITPKLISKIIDNRVIRFSSDASYAVYLFHGFFISLVGIIISKQPTLLSLIPYQRVLVIIVFVTILAYLLSFIIFKFIELPGIQLGKKVIAKISPIKK